MRHVLVCLDRSAFDERSLAAAVALVGAGDARITLLHVLEPSLEFGRACPTDPLAWEVGRREAHGYLHQLRARVAASGIAAQMKLVEGHAAERILAEMRTDDVDLTILARHGRHGAGEWSLSSTAQKVLSRFTGSVLIMPTPSREAVAWSTPPRRVVVPLDGSVRAECALAMGRTIAAAHNAELVLVHVVGEPSGPPQPRLELDDTELVRELSERWERSARRYLGRFMAELRTSHSKVRFVIERSGDIRRALVAIAEREGADLIVLSAHGITCNSERPYGSVAEHLIHFCDRPLLLLQDLQSSPSGRVAAEHAAPPVADGRLP